MKPVNPASVNGPSPEPRKSGPTLTSYHVCLDLREALKNWNNRQLSGLFRDKAGSYLSAGEAKDYLISEIAKGRKVIPYGGPCNNFSYEDGCLGHAATVPTPDMQVEDGESSKGLPVR